MSPHVATPPAADRNLLLAVLALQMDFVGRDELIEAMNAWVLEKAKPLGQVLVERGALAPDVRGVLETVVDKHLQRHGGDPARSLAAARAGGPIRLDVGRLADPQVRASLAGLDAEYPPTAPRLAPDHSPPTIPPIAAPRVPADGPGSPGMRFRVLRPHARGGLGQVFVARDEELQREVALKEIQAQLADHPPSRARFLLEATITGGLEHPGIVPVYGLGAYPDGRPYYAMRFIRGESLQEAIRRFHEADKARRDRRERALELRGLLDRFVDMCNAIAYAHSRGVLHRDLKPANVMLGPYGETLVVDWGLAKSVGRPEEAADADEQTLRPDLAGGSAPTRGPLGTPGYMSPEQAAGRPDKLGPASDVYSLGATLYHLLTGRMPFEGTDLVTTLGRVQRGDFPRPREANPAVPPALEAICLKAMALRPEDRYASARDLAGEVVRWLADEPVAAYPEPWAVRVSRWVRRNRVALSMVALALMAALASSALFLWDVARRDNRHLAAEAERLDAEKGRLVSEKGQLSGEIAAAQREKDRLQADVEARRHQTRAQAVRQIHQQYSLGEIGPALDALQAYHRDFPGAAESFDVAYLRNLLRSSTRTLEGHTGEVRAIRVAADGRTATTASEDGTLRTWDLESGLEQAVVPYTPGIVGIRPEARDDGTIAVGVVVEDTPAGRSGEIRAGDRLVSVAEGDAEPVPLAGLPPERTIKLIQGPPGTTVSLTVLGEGDAEPRTVRLQRQPMKVRWGQHRQFSPDGRWLAFTEPDGGVVHLIEVATGRLHDEAFKRPAPGLLGRLTTPGGPARICALAIDPSSARIAVGYQGDGRVLIGDLETRKWAKTLQGLGPVPAGACWSPNGAWLYAGNGGDVGLGAWDVASGKQAWQPVPNLVNSGEQMLFSPDGSRLIWGGGLDPATYLVQALPAHADDPTPIQVLPRASKNQPVFAFSPGGTLVATASESRIYLWYARQARLLRVLEVERGQVRDLAFSTDGRRLLACVGTRVVIYDLDADDEFRSLAFGSGDYLTAVEFDPSRNQLLAGVGGSKDLGAEEPPAHVAATDLASGRPAGRLFGPGWPQATANLAVSPDGLRLALVKTPLNREALEEALVEIWDLAERRVVASNRLPLPPGAFDLDFSPDGALLAVTQARPLLVDDLQGSRSLSKLRKYPLFLLDGRTAEVLDRLPHPEACTMSRFTPDGKALVTLSGDGASGRITVWDLAGRTPLRTFAARANVIAVSPDGRRLATAYHGPSYSLRGRPVHVAVRDLETGEPAAEWIDEEMLGRVDTTALRFSPDGHLLAAGTIEGHLRVWDWSRREAVARGRVPGAAGGFGVFSVLFHPSGDALVVSSGPIMVAPSGAVLRWDFRAGRFETLSRGLTNPILCTPSRDGKLASVSAFTNEVSVWDLPAGTSAVLVPASTPPEAATRGEITALASSPDGRWLALADDYSTVLLVDRAGGRVVHSWGDALHTAEALRFSPDGRTLTAAGRRVAQAGADPVGMIVAWDVETGHERARRETCPLGSLAENEASRIYAFADLSADGRLAAFVANVAGEGRRSTVQLWGLDDGQPRATLRGDDADLRSFIGVNLDPAGKTLATLSTEGLDPAARVGVAHFVRLWDVATGRLLRRWRVTRNHQDRPEQGALRATLSPDGRLVAVGLIRERVGLWDAASGLRLMDFDLEHGSGIRVLRFSPDGRALVAATLLGAARLYQVR